MKYEIIITQPQKCDIIDQETGEVYGYSWFIQYTMIVPDKFYIASNYTANQNQLSEFPTISEIESLIAGTFGYPYPPETVN